MLEPEEGDCPEILKIHISEKVFKLENHLSRSCSTVQYSTVQYSTDCEARPGNVLDCIVSTGQELWAEQGQAGVQLPGR